jgi:hypothetical protein
MKKPHEIMTGQGVALPHVARGHALRKAFSATSS